MIIPDTFRRYMFKELKKALYCLAAKDRPMPTRGGSKVTVTATPLKELFNSFLAQVKLAAAPAATGISRELIEK